MAYSSANNYNSGGSWDKGSVSYDDRFDEEDDGVYTDPRTGIRYKNQKSKKPGNPMVTLREDDQPDAYPLAGSSAAAAASRMRLTDIDQKGNRTVAPGDVPVAGDGVDTRQLVQFDPSGGIVVDPGVDPSLLTVNSAMEKRRQSWYNKSGIKGQQRSSQLEAQWDLRRSYDKAKQRRGDGWGG